MRAEDAARSGDISRNLPILSYKNGVFTSRMDPVITEEWLKVYLEDRLISETPVTPRDLPDLVTGLLFGEGLIHPNDQLSLRFTDDKCYAVITESGCKSEPPGSEKYSNAKERKALSKQSQLWTPEHLFFLMDAFQKLPSVYHETGGAHMAAFGCDHIIHWADDISRRNAVDKVLGKGFLAKTDFSKGIILSSGRISSDLILKMVRLRIPVIASVSAPSDKAVALALENNITICAFVRGRRFNIYSGAERLNLK